MQALLSFITEKQEEKTNILLKFKNNGSIYITPETTLTPISEDLIHIEGATSSRGNVNNVYNWNDFSSAKIINKKEG